MFGLRQLTAWWRGRRARHINRMVARDPRTASATAQSVTAGRQRDEATRQVAQALRNQREIEALKAAARAARFR